MVYKQSLLMGAGTILNSLLGLVFYVLAARSLSVSDFGQFMFVLAIGLLIAEVGDFGFTNSLIKFGSGDKFPRVFTAVFSQRVILTIVILLFGIIWPQQAAIAVSLLFFSLGYQSLITRQQYGLYIIDNIAGNLARLLVLALVGPTWAFVWANIFAFTLAFVFLRLKTKTPLLDFTGVKSELIKIAKFSGWLGSSYSLASVAAKIDVPILYVFAGPVAVGIYSSAQKLASVVPQMAGALESVFAPKLSSDPKSKINDYLIIAIVAGFGLLVASFLSPYLILPFGPKYAQSAGVLSIFFLGFIPLFLSGPFAASILYRFGKARWHFLVSVLTLGISTLMYFILIPKFGGNGAALTILAGNFAGFTLYFLLWRKLTKT